MIEDAYDATMGYGTVKLLRVRWQIQRREIHWLSGAADEKVVLTVRVQIWR